MKLRQLASIFATVACLAAGVILAGEYEVMDIPLEKNTVFTNTVSTIVDLTGRGYRPNGYFSVHATVSDGGSISNINTYVSIFGPDNTGASTHTNLSSYVWTTNEYTAVASNVASTNCMYQTFQVPTRYLKVEFVPSSGNAATNILDARMIVH